jgi:hypothetical protein
LTAHSKSVIELKFTGIIVELVDVETTDYQNAAKDAANSNIKPDSAWMIK